MRNRKAYARGGGDRVRISVRGLEMSKKNLKDLMDYKKKSVILRQYAYVGPIYCASFDGDGVVDFVEGVATDPEEARSRLRAVVEAKRARAKAEIEIQESRLRALEAEEILPSEMTIDEILELKPDDECWVYHEHVADNLDYCDRGSGLRTKNLDLLTKALSEGWRYFRTEADCRKHCRITAYRQKLAEMEEHAPQS